MNRTDKRCTQCAISGAFPQISFDDKGVCSFCRDQAYYVVEDDAIDRARIQVKALFAEKQRGRYDALVCLSGGKDSTYTLMLAVRKYGLRTLALTFDNGFLSAFAFDNVRSAVNALGVDHLMLRPSFPLMKAIIRTSAVQPLYHPRTLTRISAVCNSCITMINTAAVSTALEKQIPFVIAGFTLGQIPSNAVIYRPNYRWIQESREKAAAELERHCGRTVRDHLFVRDDLLQGPMPWLINLLCLESVSEKRMLQEISTLGWKQPDDVDGCSSNCRLNAFNNYAHEKVYGYNPYELELSHLIRKGLLTREEALEKLAISAQSQVAAILYDLKLASGDLESAHLRGNKEAVLGEHKSTR